MSVKNKKLSGFDIVCPSWIEWDHVPLMMHHMAKLLSENNRVLFLDPPVAVSTILIHPSLAGYVKNGLSNWWGGPRKVAENLWVWTPPPLLLHLGLSRFSDKLDLAQMRRSVNSAVKKLGFKDFIIWSWNPTFFEGRPEIGERLVCLDCNDRVAPVAPRIKRKRMEDIEYSFAEAADLVFATAPALVERFSSIRKDVHLFPSGVDTATFSRARDTRTQPARDIEGLSKPVIGYIGVLDGNRLDMELLFNLAEARPSWSFSFVGPEWDRSCEKLKNLPNCHFHGKKTPDELPGYLKIFDVALIPFKVSEFSSYSFPTKTFEYFAAGTPVVSSPIPALESFVPLLRLATTPAEYLTAIESLLEEEPDHLRNERIECAENRTWVARLRDTSKLVIEALEQTKARGAQTMNAGRV